MAEKTRKQRIEELLAENPDDPLLHYDLAMICVSDGDDEAAVARFHDLIGRAPKYVPAYQQCGQALLRLGKDEEARAVLTTGIATARSQGEQHPADEMQGMLESMD
ncbi:MAG: tetratricopeptide repeat protein [Gemmataceae bacterium]